MLFRSGTYATVGYVTQQINSLIGGAPAILDTLNELALALNDDANFASSVATTLSNKLDLTGGTISGSLQSLGGFIGNLSGTATNATNAGYAKTAGIATVSGYATNAGVSTYAVNAGVATYAPVAGIATYATSAGVATNAYTAGIATVAQGLTGTPNVTVGIITANSFVKSGGTAGQFLKADGSVDSSTYATQSYVGLATVGLASVS